MASYRSAKKKKVKKKVKSTPTIKIRSSGVASTTTTTPTTTMSTTPTSSSSGSSKPRKLVRAPSVKLAEEEDNMIASSPTLSRAILSGAAAVVFKELDPNNNDNDNNKGAGNSGVRSASSDVNVDVDKISKIAGDDEADKIHSPTTTKSPKSNNKTKNKNNNNMDIVISRAKRLGNRVLDQSRGAARRGDQRREFRMYDALSKLDGGDGEMMKRRIDAVNTIQAANPFHIPSAHTLPLIVPNPFVVSPGSTDVEDNARSDSVVNDIKRNNSVVSSLMKLDNDAEWTGTR